MNGGKLNRIYISPCIEVVELLPMAVVLGVSDVTLDPWEGGGVIGGEAQ